MVKFRNGPFKEGIDNKVFIIPAIIVVSLIGVCHCSVYCIQIGEQPAQERIIERGTTESQTNSKRKGTKQEVQEEIG